MSFATTIKVNVSVSLFLHMMLKSLTVQHILAEGLEFMWMTQTVGLPCDYCSCYILNHVQQVVHPLPLFSWCFINKFGVHKKLLKNSSSESILKDPTSFYSFPSSHKKNRKYFKITQNIEYKLVSKFWLLSTTPTPNC